jgi:hypothetical protein
MKQILLQEKYPVFKLEIDKSETEYKSAQAVINYFKQLIDDHEVTRFIAEFDHYSHTKGLLNGQLDEAIIDARNIIFCFGTQLAKAEMLAVRPRSIGIAETLNKIIVSFMEAPMAVANDTIEFWVKSLVNQELKH